MATLNRSDRLTPLSVAATVALAALSTTQLLAQAQVQATGHANDANNQLGGGGYNTPTYRSTPNTQLQTTATPGLGQLHVPQVGFDPNVVAVNSQNQGFDQFITNSGPTNAGRPTGTPGYAPYYDPQTYTGPSRWTPSQPAAVGQAPAAGDTRLPAVSASPLNHPAVPQSTVGPSSVDTAEPSPYVASSLYGVRTPQANPTAAAPVAVAPDASSPAVPIAPQSPLLVDLERRSAAAGGHAEAPVISSLATGIQPAALASLMEAAEAQMRSGQFVHAIATYGSAGRLAPDNPLVVLGRACAELGAGYYGRAEADLAAAVEVEPALLVGRYDLVKFLGSDRLSAVRKELVDLAATEPAARPFTLLAFIGHNTGDTDTAVATNLDTAQTRGADAHLLDAMRSAWHLPAAVQK